MTRPGIIYSGHYRYRWDPRLGLPVRLYNRRETGAYVRRRWLARVRAAR